MLASASVTRRGRERGTKGRNKTHLKNMSIAFENSNSSLKREERILTEINNTFRAFYIFLRHSRYGSVKETQHLSAFRGGKGTSELHAVGSLFDIATKKEMPENQAPPPLR